MELQEVKVPGEKLGVLSSNLVPVIKKTVIIPATKDR